MSVFRVASGTVFFEKKKKGKPKMVSSKQNKILINRNEIRLLTRRTFEQVITLHTLDLISIITGVSDINKFNTIILVTMH
jgi:hypothetical protein